MSIGRKHAWDQPIDHAATCTECGMMRSAGSVVHSDCPGPYILEKRMEVNASGGPRKPDEELFVGKAVERDMTFKPTWGLRRSSGVDIDSIASMLGALDPDAKRDGLRETPTRVAKYWGEMTAGHDVDIASLFKTFDHQTSNDLVIVKDIDFVSTCEHHLALFHGKAHVGYIPNDGRIIGLSKVVRCVDAFARRLQVQERITAQVADAMMLYLVPKGVIVCLTNVVHTCMMARGVRSQALTTTSAVRGVFENDSDARHEFLTLIGSK